MSSGIQTASDDGTSVESHQAHHVRLTEPPESERYHHEGEEGAISAPHEGLPSCSLCHNPDAQYESFPCRCLKFCKKCAMKMATGGKCKNCHQLFSTMVLGAQNVESHHVHHLRITEPPQDELPSHQHASEPAHVFTNLPAQYHCAHCNNPEGEYISLPCKCHHYCKKCAMKMPTGGKCHTCHAMISMHHISLPHPTEAVPAPSTNA
mmetsp:Transcript_4792/g.3413  ORF Transcript_4792/g.3413 Transcript_4792/m.3413 type:complete len:207 (-) Transcript_4792:65-685(-)|eukprot:CAMPEP_0202966284 /NCGR_PEP_ID=MMETSP1396-20130829/10628_1 /ASSEMBLY_ACC=CAM_ASM_000872 /TAXON_ID= /ORGANISM="Pseudokeronopsis sp., Strain Brazil" /LENGTH=206 /DNA_ID=CAMNT_0049689949 /DNA_START=54 /DNA_END=674 /DNA_ORIENTATION=-